MNESSSHSSDEKLYRHRDLIMQTHLQIRNPHHRNTEYHNIRDQIRNSCPEPSLPWFHTVTSRQPWRPGCLYRSAGGAIVDNGAEKKTTHSGKCDSLD